MPEIITAMRGDQAEGLRRLLDRSAPRMVTLVSACAGVGKTSVAIQLAAALAARGTRVLLIDENAGATNVGALLRISPRRTLEDVMRGECGITDALARAGKGIAVLPAAGVLPALRLCSAAVREQLAAAFTGVESRFDVVLADTARHGDGGCMQVITGASHDTIVVSSPSTRSVTATYALIKRLHHMRRQHRFHVLLNRVAREENARTVLQNLIGVARSRLHTPVESLGCVPRDDALRAVPSRLRYAMEGQSATASASASAVRFRYIADVITTWPGTRARQGFLNQFMQCMNAGGMPVPVFAGV